MKATLIVLGLACFVGALHALPVQEEEESDVTGAFLGDKPQTFPNFEGEVKGIRTTRAPQIHHNAIRSQGPLSGRLTNVVLNRRGSQKTMQVNRIEYNLNSVQQLLRDLLGNEEVSE